MYVKFQNAAVFVEDRAANHFSAIGAGDPTPPVQSCRTTPPSWNPPNKEARSTLWADRPFTVPRGRLIGVRKSGKLVEVALVVGSSSTTWVAADEVLSQAQINRWLASSSFR